MVVDEATQGEKTAFSVGMEISCYQLDFCAVYPTFFSFSRQLGVLRCFDSIRISVAAIFVHLKRVVVFIFRTILDFIYCWNGRLDVLYVLFKEKKRCRLGQLSDNRYLERCDFTISFLLPKALV